jgi:hypothetical protein
MVCALLQLGFSGLQIVVDLAARDFNSMQPALLATLLNVRTVQRIILVPSILSQLNHTGLTVHQRQELLALLNRLGTLVWEAGGLPILVSLLDDGQVDRQLVCSVIRTSGSDGEQLLLKLLKYHKNEKVRMAAACVLSHRLPSDPRQIQVEMVLDTDDSMIDK